MARLLSAIASFLPIATAAQFGMPQPVETTGHHHPAQPVLVDLDNDGSMDVVVAANDIGWYRNLGGGEFAPFKVLEAGESVYFGLPLACGDLNGDGLPDLVYASTPFMISWKQNLGNGLFNSPSFIADLADVRSFTIDDFTGDGLADILVVRQYSPSAILFRNEGDSWLPDTIPSTDLILSIHVWDLNNDGAKDFVAMMRNSVWGVTGHFLNDGNGSFALSQSFEQANSTAGTGSYQSGSQCADIDGNGTPDLLVSHFNSNVVSVAKTNIDGTIRPLEILSNVPGPRGLSLTDIDDDGTLDFTVVASGVRDIALRRNINGGSPLNEYLLERRLIPYWTSTGDIDQDGDSDILVGYLRRISWIEFENGNQIGEHEIGNIISAIRNILSDDVDDDGDADIIVASNEGVHWFQNDAGEFTERYSVLTYESAGTERVAKADLDGDSDIDLISSIDKHLLLHRKLGSGAYAPPDTIFSSTRTLLHAMGDMDLDGDIDLIVFQSDDRQTFLLRNDGSGAFGIPEEIYPAQPSPYTNYEYLAMDDLNGDGSLDFAFSHEVSSSGVVKVFLNNGDGGFAAPMNINGLNASPGFWFLDIDADGDLDIGYRVGNNYSTGVYRKNNGVGVFSGLETSIPGVPIVTNIIDLNGDGIDDLITWGAVFLGAGNGTYVPSFEPGSSIEASAAPPPRDQRHFVDIDGDGLPDQIDDDWYQGLRWRRNLYNSPYRISGGVFADMDADQTHGPGEPFLSFFPVAFTPYPGTVMTDSAGLFSTTVDLGSYTITPQTTSSYWAPQPTPVTVELTESEPTSTNNLLGIQPLVDISMIEPSITFTTTGPCGTPGTFWLSAANQGTRIEQGTMTAEIDPEYTYISSVPEPSSINGNIYTWSFDSLNYFGHTQVALNVIRPLEGGELNNRLTVNTVDDGGTATGTFTDSLHLENLCSYDPNDKQVFPVGNGQAGAVPISTTDLDYVVRFQNTGTAPAHDVIILDVLPASVDRQQIRLLGYSHAPDEIRVDNDGEMRIRFNNIMLPDSGADLLGSQGYVRFNIGLQSGLPHGTTINNTAGIIFDLNAPVITNTTQTTLVDCALWQPTITEQGGIVLGASTGIKYQWYLDGEELLNDTARVRAITEEGSYTVSVTSSYGCVATAGPYQVIGLDVAELSEHAFHLAPNPFSSTAELMSRHALTSDHSIELIDLHGKVLRTWRGTSGHITTIDRQGVRAGLYTLRIALRGKQVGHVRVVLD